MSTEELFQKAVYMIREGPPRADATTNEKLKIYGLFKQATVGDNNTPQPWAVQLEARAKWDAWDSHRGKSKETAMEDYIAILNEQDPSWLESATMKNYKA